MTKVILPSVFSRAEGDDSWANSNVNDAVGESKTNMNYISLFIVIRIVKKDAALYRLDHWH